MLSFANKELLTTEGIYYLKIDIANCMGYDKETWTTRVFKANAIVKDVFYKTIKDTDYVRDFHSIENRIIGRSKYASAPLLFIKAMFAYHKGVVLGEPIGHDMGLDSTASGLQFLGALSGCTTTASNCNIHAKIERKYTDEVAEKLAELEAELASL